LDAYDGRATARWNLDDLEGARADFDSLLKFAPDNEHGRIGRGQLRREMGDLEGALEDVDRVLIWDPENVEALSERARVLLLKGDLDSAMKCVNKSVGLTRIVEADAMYTIRRRGEKDLDDLIHDNAYARYVRGQIRVALQDFDGAIADYTEALHHDPDSDYRQTARGEALWLKGNVEAALADFEATLGKYKDEPDARAGRVRAAKGDVTGARDDFEVALKNSHRWWHRRAEAEAALKSLSSSP
jgi:tetratricopeptide (TPR) repeat protein